MENHPALVARLARGKLLLGNAPETLRRVRDPGRLFPAVARRGFAVPETILPGGPLPTAGRWLSKPVRSGGGVGVRVWTGQPLAAGRMLQAHVEGTPASAAFVADGARCVLLGWTEQLPGPRGFLYGGNLLPLGAPAAVLDEVRRLAETVTSEFGLRGLNGIDFVLRGDRPVLLEVNPRYCASMELVDRAAGVSAFAFHVAACRGTLPEPVGVPEGAWGKAIVYAPRRLAVGDTLAWLERGVRDVPPPDAIVEAGHPICTVLAAGADRAACAARLEAEVDAVLGGCRSVPAPA
jgi:predicted ATP-grasp superfamily ATP-dependent carboligase